MRLSLHTDYGIRILLYTAGKGEELSTTKEISEFYGISYNHLVKVVHTLGKKGFLETTRGRNGGYKLSRKPKDISLGQIVRSLEPDFKIVECFSAETNQCRITNYCLVKGHLQKALKHYLAELDQVNLNSLVRSNMISSVSMNK